MAEPVSVSQWADGPLCGLCGHHTRVHPQLGQLCHKCEGMVRTSCPTCNGAKTALYDRYDTGQLYCECGYAADEKTYAETVYRQTVEYFCAMPGLADGSWFRTAVRFGDELAKRRVRIQDVEKYLRVLAVSAEPPIGEWQLSQALELIAKRELSRRGKTA